jgi:LmbE family N-acetylglucosaminyl deacetylase
MLPPEDIERVLVVTAHPDDVDFGAAATVATLTDAGATVTYCLVTDGEAGGRDREMPRADMAQLRREEQTAAAKHVGVDQLVWLGRPDGRLVPDLDLRLAITRVIRTVRPQLVITQSPERVLERIIGSHPDHLATGEATLCAVYPDSRNPFAFPELLEIEGLEPWDVPEIWVMAFAGTTGAHSIEVTASIDRKIAALLAHESQHVNPAAMADLVRGWMTENAEAAGLAEGTSAEVFRVITIP